jgi:hypothetical protein
MTHKGGCHCGAVEFAFTSPAVVDVTHCDCSICSMTAYQHVFIPQTELTFASGKDNLALYTFGTEAAKHLFCKTCGIKPLYIPRSHPDCYSVNLRCVRGGTLTEGKRIAFSGINWEKNISDLKAKT